MKKFRLLIIIACALVGVLSGVLYFRGYGGGDGKLKGENAETALRKAPGFELKDPDGKVHRLQDFRGKIVILHFWASWCPPCLAEISHWVELSRRFKDKPVAWVAVSLDSKWEDALKVFPNKNLSPSLVSLLDESGKVPEEYGTYQFPETYILNSKLEILTKWVGPQDWENSAVTAWIDKALAKI